MLEAQNLLPPSKIILSEEVLNCLSVIALADKNNFFVLKSITLLLPDTSLIKYNLEVIFSVSGVCNPTG